MKIVVREDGKTYEVQERTRELEEAAARKDGLDADAIPYGEFADQGQIATWGADLGEWATYNLSLDFPLTGELTAAGMAARGTPVDGVIGLDARIVAAIKAMGFWGAKVPLPQKGSMSGDSGSQPDSASSPAARFSRRGASPLSSRQPRLNRDSPEVSRYNVPVSAPRNK